MQTLAFDGRMGASGDMLLAALLAAGADRSALAPVEDALPIRYEVGATDKNGISATTVAVLLDDENGDGDRGVDHHDHSHEGHNHSHDHGDHEHDHSHDHGDHEHDHSHDHGDHEHDHSHDDHSHDNDDNHSDGHAHDKHDHSHSHGHNHEHSHAHAEGSGALRTYPEVVEIVKSMDLPERVGADALAIFERLGEAESNVHGTDLKSTHFHEVGADDAIADVVGVALLVNALAPDRVVTTPLATGGGEVEMSHGIYPVPTPATVEIAERADWSLRGGPVEAELLTPTGAAILSHFAEGVEHLPSLRIDSSGYGAGGYDFPDHPNVLRAMIGKSESGAGSLTRDDIAILETNLDDVPPEILGGLQESLSEVGARDVSIVPLTMKKSRPGHLVKVICKPADAERVARRLAEETGTLGIRQAGATHRWIAQRAFEAVAVEFDGDRYEVDVKIASDEDGEVYDVSAEYDDCAEVAREADVAVREVMRQAENEARNQL